MGLGSRATAVLRWRFMFVGRGRRHTTARAVLAGIVNAQPAVNTWACWRLVRYPGSALFSLMRTQNKTHARGH